MRLENQGFWDAVENALGEEFVERHQQGMGAREEFQSYASFREGFRLGVSLMMELR